MLLTERLAITFSFLRHEPVLGEELSLTLLPGRASPVKQQLPSPPGITLQLKTHLCFSWLHLLECATCRKTYTDLQCDTYQIMKRKVRLKTFHSFLILFNFPRRYLACSLFTTFFSAPGTIWRSMNTQP